MIKGCLIWLHDEMVVWMRSLDDAEWDRTVVVTGRLAALGSTARMPLSRSLGDGLFELRFSLGPTARADHVQVHEEWTDRVAHHVP